VYVACAQLNATADSFRHWAANRADTSKQLTGGKMGKPTGKKEKKATVE
jgi:hypothetical protein